ncbi:MAG: hypothetical protein R6U89_10915 [Dehalococcoidia bacterium]
MVVPRILVISEQQLLSQGLKLIIEGTGPAEVITAPDEATGAGMIADLTPRIVVVDRDAAEEGQGRSMSEEDYPDKVVIIGSSSDEKMVVYSRQKVNQATLENLLDTIRENQT